MQMQKLLRVGGLMTLLGCADTVKPGDLAISITLTNAKSVIRSGDTLGISVTALNVGDRTITLTDYGCPRPFRIYGPDSEPVFVQDICSAVGVNRQIRPGDSHTFQFTWVAEKADKSPLATGSYLLRGHVAAAEFGPVEAGSINVYILP
jgi:hypothetical protein